MCIPFATGMLQAMSSQPAEAPSPSTSTMQIRQLPGTARAGEDFAAYAGGRAEFADNQPLRAIYVPLMRDSIAEPDEEFFVELSDAGPETRIWPVSRVAVTIQDDD